MINILICDDEKPFLNILKNRIEDYFKRNNIENMIRCFESGKDLIKCVTKIDEIDIIFLDINMEELSGIELAKEIRKYSSKVFIVFVTAFINYSLEGYKVDAVRYILKSNEEGLNDAITECLDTIVARMDYCEPVKQFNFVEGIKNISLEKVIFVESKLHKLLFYIADDKQTVYSMYDTLNNFEKELNNSNFVRVHQSFLVNLKYIKHFEEHSKHYKTKSVVLYNGREISVPKKRVKTVRTAIIDYRGEM